MKTGELLNRKDFLSSEISAVSLDLNHDLLILGNMVGIITAL